MRACKATGLLDGCQEVGEDGLGDAVLDDSSQHWPTVRAGDEVTAARLSQRGRAGLPSLRAPEGPETKASLKTGRGNGRDLLLQNLRQRYPAFLPLNTPWAGE